MIPGGYHRKNEKMGMFGKKWSAAPVGILFIKNIPKTVEEDIDWVTWRPVTL
jgi:hypothetical protein